MDRQRLKYLFESFINRTILPGEKEELLHIIDNNDEEDLSEVLADIIDSSGREEISLEDWTNLVTRSTSADKPAIKVRSFKTSYRWVAAAAVVLLISISSYLSFDKFKRAEEITSVIEPGGNKAMLIMDDGSSIELDKDLKTDEVLALNPKIKSVSDGEIVYNKVEGENPKAGTNTLVVPKGGQYRIVLPDGTVAWLNSGSELRFPSVFDKHARQVELKGEAYFEVTSYKKKWPFIVKSLEQKIEVLGTKFNVSAYHNDDFIKTTLLEGMVKVTNEFSNDPLFLKPGQEAVLSKKSNSMQVFVTEVEESIAWKEGLFVFNNEDLHDAMNKISRWYDVVVVYEGDFKGKAFWGTVSRKEKLESLLKTLQATGVAKFKVEGRRVVVMR